jgi:hypothetical protein
MAQRAQKVTDWDDESPGSMLFGRFLLWAGLAALAVGSVVWAAQTQTGTERIAHMFDRSSTVASAAPRGVTTVPIVRPSDSEIEQRRLAETVRALAADRDRLAARLETLERNVDVTGSTPPARTDSAPVGLAPPLITGWSPGAFAPGALPPAAGIPMAPVIPAPAQAGGGPALAATEQGAESTATRTEFAVDIGGDPSLEGLRARWASLKAGHAALFEGLRPLVAIREGGKSVELRLVVGPLANAVAAARLCASLSAAGQACQPTIFDGQRLALR